VAGGELPAFVAGSAPDASGAAERLEGQRGVLIARGAAELGGRDVVLQGLEGCRVLLLGVVGALRCQDLRRCEVVVGAVASSALLHDCHECVVTLATKQLRLHDSGDVLLHLSTRSRPTVERSRRVLVAPFDLRYPGVEGHLAEAALADVDSSSAWAEVQDFDWHKRQASPHWRVVPPELRREPLDLAAPGAGAAGEEPSHAEPVAVDLAALDRCRPCWTAAEAPEEEGQPGGSPAAVPTAPPPAPEPTSAKGSLGPDDEF